MPVTFFYREILPIFRHYAFWMHRASPFFELPIFEFEQCLYRFGKMIKNLHPFLWCIFLKYVLPYIPFCDKLSSKICCPKSLYCDTFSSKMCCPISLFVRDFPQRCVALMATFSISCLAQESWLKEKLKVLTCTSRHHVREKFIIAVLIKKMCPNNYRKINYQYHDKTNI